MNPLNTSTTVYTIIYKAIFDRSSICLLYIELTKIDWNPKQANNGMSKAIFGVTTILRTDSKFFHTLDFSCSFGLFSTDGFNPNRITEPKALTTRNESTTTYLLPSTRKRMEVDPFQPGPPVSLPTPIALSKKNAQVLPRTYSL